jgi:hypothetical protein
MALNPCVDAVRKWQKDGAKVDYYGSNWGEAAEEGKEANGSSGQ